MSIKFIGLTIEIQYLEDDSNNHERNCEATTSINQAEIMIPNYTIAFPQLKIGSNISKTSRL